jgi:hypothetical protein
MHTAVHPTVRLDAVTDNPALAVGTGRRQPVNGAFETIEIVFFAGENYLKRFVVLVPAGFT